MSTPIFRQPTEHPKGWGHETWLASNDRYCGKLLCFNQGARFSAHFHDKKDESFFLLQGRVKFIYNDLSNADQHEVILNPGDVVDIPRLCVHQVEALETSIIIEVSSPDYSFDSYRVRKGDSQAAKSEEAAAREQERVFGSLETEDARVAADLAAQRFADAADVLDND